VEKDDGDDGLGAQEKERNKKEGLGRDEGGEEKGRRRKGL